MSHYRFTENMTFLIDTEKKTIQIIGSYRYEDLEDAQIKVLCQYEGYTLLPCKPKE